VKAWDWGKFKGSEPALKYARRDLATLDRAMHLTKGRTACVQAGACLGIFPKYLARFFATVYTFEPSLEFYPLLAANAPELNILKYQAALGRAGESPITTSQTRREGKSHRFPHEGITHVSGADGPVPVLALDALNLHVCDLIVLDLEGYEMNALLGSRETIERCRPVLMVEINDNLPHYGYTEDQIREVIVSMGYEMVERIHSDELYVPTEARLYAHG
jgi:FkbM family methyltransferase